MNATDYQKAAARTLISTPDHPFSGTELMLMWCTLGLTGEAGEIAEHIKKTVCHQHGDVLSGESRLKVKEELGDLMWYVASIAFLCNINLGTIMESNIAKLRQRYPDGYNSADSKARVDQLHISGDLTDQNAIAAFVARTKADQIPELPQPTIGALDTCKMCGASIRYIDPYWDHQGEMKPRHPATPVRYATDYNPTLF